MSMPHTRGRRMRLAAATVRMTRRLTLLVAALSIAPLQAAAQIAASVAPAITESAAAHVRAVVVIGMTVSDMDRAIAFYTDVLDFVKLSDVEVLGPEHERLQGVFGARMRVVRLRLGDELLELTEYLAPRGRPIPADARSNDRSFQHVAIIVSDMDAAYRRLRENGVVHSSTGPQLLPDWNPNAGGIEAFYFRDPDGHTLEVLRFPPGKGDARWQANDRLFLGIDHTAIVIGDTDATLAFYRDALGFTVAGTSENWGIEQEHLNAVFGARLRITALRAPGGGPAIELLEYLAPRDGRPYPEDARANDIIHWQTTLLVDDAEATARRVHAARGTWISPGAIHLADDRLGFTAAALIRDPHGHALRIIQR